MMKARLLLGIAVICVVTSPLFAQADAPATREDVLKLFDTMKLHEQMKATMDMMMKQQRAMIHEGVKRRSPQVSEEELARMDQFTNDIVRDMPVDGLLDDMTPVYQKHLSKSDVEAMNTFYASPTGQKLLREMPAMMSEAMQAANPRIQAMMDKVMDRAEQMAKEEEKRGKSPTPAAEKK
jgi:uncharacterized protein